MPIHHFKHMKCTCKTNLQKQALWAREYVLLLSLLKESFTFLLLRQPHHMTLSILKLAM